MVWRTSINIKTKLYYSLVITIISAIIFSYITDKTCKGMVCRGDFPAFYSAAMLFQSGQDVYNLDLQREIQNKFWPSLNGDFLYYSYPPYAVVISSPISFINPLSSKIVVLFLSVFIYVLTLQYISKYSINDLETLIIFSILFFPILIALVSGQNFFISFALLSILYLTKFSTRKGLCVGLLAFKPHFAFFALVGLIFSKQYSAAIYAFAILAIYFIISSFYFGFSWPSNWLSVVDQFYYLDFLKNGHQMASLVSFFEYHNFKIIGYVITLIIFIRYLILCAKYGNNAFVNILPSVIVICSPHTMYYDLPLIMIPSLIRRNIWLNSEILVVLILSLGFIFYKSNLTLLLITIIMLIQNESIRKYETKT